jgi:uncharacterized iron-regulated membrane protein
MTEGLFILTTIFVAYVIYQVIGDQNAAAKSRAPAAKPEAQATAVAQVKPEVAVAEAKPAPPKAAEPKPAAPAETKTTATKTTASKKATAAVAQSAGLKNPKTGEVATSYGNYRFAKRWIKEALVAEGLVEKIYSGNELSPETEAKIKAALTA